MPYPSMMGDESRLALQRDGVIQDWRSNDHRQEAGMVTKALFVRIEAKPGREADVERFLDGGLTLVEAEPATTTWFAVRMGPSTFGIFDAFPDDAGRQAHLSGKVAQALGEKTPELFAQPPTMEKLDVLAAKLPQRGG